MLKKALVIMSIVGSAACGRGSLDSQAPAAAPVDRKYLLERVDEAAVVQMYADGFDELSLKEKTLVWHLYQAALAGRDIFYDQRYAHNLEMRDVLEAILTHATGVDPKTLAEIERYTKLFWINSGPYNNLTARKFVLACTPEAFAAAVQTAAKAGAAFPLKDGETARRSCSRACSRCSSTRRSIRWSRTRRRRAGRTSSRRAPTTSTSGVTMKDLEGLHGGARAQLAAGEAGRPDRRRGLPRRTAATAARSPRSSSTWRRPFRLPPSRWPKALRALVKFYRTGDKADREAYDIAWVQDKASPVDTINGFIEVYLDARGIKGAWEGLVFYVNREKTTEIQKIAAERAVVRGPHAVGSRSTGSRASRASRPTRSTS